MPRSQRIEFPGAWYHVMNRGVDRGALFRDDRDRERFLGGVAALDAELGIACHAYCLMDNHFHLLLETREGGLGAGMTRLGRTYARRFNDRHGRDGPLFRARYTAVLVDSERYLLEVGRYIHLNPVRAGSVRDAADWLWSSAAAYAGRRPAGDWLHRSVTLARFRGGDPAAAYVRFLEDGVDAATRAFYESKRRRSIFGDADFRRRWRRWSKS